MPDPIVYANEEIDILQMSHFGNLDNLNHNRSIYNLSLYEHLEEEIEILEINVISCVWKTYWKQLIVYFI